MVEEVELGKARLHERLKAARAVQQAGYRVRLRIDPMVWFDGWEAEYARLVDTIYQYVQPEMFTLGSFRALNQLRSIIRQRFPDSPLLEAPFVKADLEHARERYPLSYRVRLYLHVLDRIRRYDPRVPVSLCKEDNEAWTVLRDKGFVPAACNCLWHPDWQAGLEVIPLAEVR